MYFVSIDAGAQVAIILLACGPCVVIVNLLGQVCTLGRAPHTKETLPDFHEWCRVTRHPRVFRGLTGCQHTPGFWGVTQYVSSTNCMFCVETIDVGLLMQFVASLLRDIFFFFLLCLLTYLSYFSCFTSSLILEPS